MNVDYIRDSLFVFCVWLIDYDMRKNFLWVSVV